jgi:hypothetical protein
VTRARARRLPPAEFQSVPLQVHRLLADVPLRDVTAIDLPGGGDGRTIADVRGLEKRRQPGGPVTRALFGLRKLLGRAFGWDAPRHDDPLLSFRRRLPPELIGRSRQAPGSDAGPFRFLYELDDEALLEIRNATVHAFLCTALRPTTAGYRLFWAVYVLPVSRLTPLYMAIIEPFRRYIVYPSLFRSIARAWHETYAAAPGGAAMRRGGTASPS